MTEEWLVSGFEVADIIAALSASQFGHVSSAARFSWHAKSSHFPPMPSTSSTIRILAFYQETLVERERQELINGLKVCGVIKTGWGPQS